MSRVIKFLFFIFLFFYFFSSPVFSADFKSDYKVEYYLSESENKVNTRVKFTIDITNLRSDIYVKKISLSFPEDFEITNLTASDNKGAIFPKVTSENGNINLSLEFTNPEVGRDSVNSFLLEFDQNSLVSKNGNIWEVILPTLNKENRNTYQVILNLPELSNKKISLAKPKPDEISGTKIIWNNPTNKTIYITLGDRQFYHTQLSYHLKNDQLVPVYTDITFPPDTLYQKTYINSILPKPSFVYRDVDGNYFGRYILKPRENYDVSYDGYTEIFITPRDEVVAVSKAQFDTQRPYLLNPDKNWDIKEKKINENINSVSDIYTFVTNHLTYDYERSSSNNVRLGAYQTLNNPTKSVCVEFTDLFIALSREKGIYSREVQGFAYSENRRFRPISLASDVLHSWPEYYDTKRNMWVPVDPTWENTSGIDYFSSFDFNHIAFVIHGKKSDYPLPAGMYKIEESKDISIKAVETKIDDLISISLDSINLPTIVNDKGKYQLKFNLINNSNIFLWALPVKVKGSSIFFSNSSIIIPELAPYEKKEVVFDFSFNPVKRKTLFDIQVLILDNEMLKKQIAVFPYYYDTALKLSYIILTITIIYIFVRLIKKGKNNERNYKS